MLPLKRRGLLRAFLPLLLCPWLAESRAQERPRSRARGPVLLSVSGELRGGAALAEFDLEMLLALPQHSFSTQTPWYPTPRKFSGPLLADVLDAAGARGQTIEARALNDYRVSIPFSDARQFKPLLALRLDDRPMQLRDKGPMFIVYPYDSDSQLRSSVYYSRSIWQLKSLAVK